MAYRWSYLIANKESHINFRLAPTLIIMTCRVIFNDFERIYFQHICTHTCTHMQFVAPAFLPSSVFVQHWLISRRLPSESIR